jgi:hypothetical protein
MIDSLRRLFWPDNRISDDEPQIQRDIDAEQGIRPKPNEQRDCYRKLSEVPQQARWGEY